MSKSERGARYRAVLEGDGGFERSATVVTLEYTSDSMLVAHFVETTKMAAQLAHPNIARIYDLGATEDKVYYVREHVDGTKLTSVLRRARSRGLKIPLDVAMFIGLRVVEAIAHAHRLGVGAIHRALDADNVVLTRHGEVKVTGFGGESLLEPARSSAPELLRGRDHDKRTNVYDVGAIVAGLVDVADRPKELEEILAQAGSFLSKDRFVDCFELYGAMRSFVNKNDLVTGSSQVAAWLCSVRISASMPAPADAPAISTPPPPFAMAPRPLIETPPRRRMARGSSSGQHIMVSPVATDDRWGKTMLLLAVSLLMFAASITVTIILS